MKIAAALLVVLAAVPADAKLVTRAVEYTHAGTKLEGYLAYDDAKTATGRRPGVLVVHEWWGLNDYARQRARQLAEMGYVAFAVDMYGKGVATEDPQRAGQLAGQLYGKPLLAERARAGLDQLLATGLVDDQRVAAIGFCFGGAAAQALAYAGAPLAGIVSFHGSPVDAPADAAGRIKTKFLLLNGAIDPTVKPEAKRAWLASLEAAKIDYESVDFGGAVHAFTNPDADRLAGTKMKGVIGYNEVAARRAWREMGDFFDEIFKK